MFSILYTHICISNGILLSHTKEWNIAICDNMNGSQGNYGKWNKSKKDIIWSFLHMESKKKGDKNQSHIYRQQMSGYHRQGWRIGVMGEGSIDLLKN